MKLPQSFLVCLCLLGATHMAWSQVKESSAHPIPGYLDPATGKFTTRVVPAASAASQNPEATPAATSVLFREDFQINITNYDQAGTTAVCSVEMSSVGDSGHYYNEQSSVTVTASGGNFSCDVPVLALWMLQTPATDQVSAIVTVTIYTPNSQAGFYGTPTVYRTSSQSLTLSQPGNTQTVVTPVNFTL